MKSSAEISQEIGDLELQEKQLIDTEYKVIQVRLELDRKIIIAKEKRNQYTMSLNKARYNLKQLRIDLSLKKKEFWASRNSGT